MSDRQLIADLLSALEYHTEQTRPIEFSRVAIEAAREYLRKPAREWVGLTRDDRVEILRANGEAAVLNLTEAKLREKNAAPFKPLTDEQIWLEYQKFWPFHPSSEPTLAKDIVKFARAIEAAHGIREKK